ncbi:MAG: HlyD family secretion protein [Acidobacteriota bacterium]|jgi:membrane fusion protein (multidrug efflux system)
MADSLLTRVRRGGPARWVLVAGAFLLVVLGVLLWRHFAVRESTDDAHIDGHVSPVAARVAGTVVEVAVGDNQLVEEGALLVRIDSRDYEVALARARADLAESEASARAARTNVPLTSTSATSQESAATSELAAAEARLATARAQLREAEARAMLAGQDVERFRPLVAKDEIPKQQFDTAVTAADTARATRDAAASAVSAAEKGVETARARLAEAGTGREQVGIVSARAASAEAKVEVSKAAVEQARLNRSYTEVRAPVRGVVSRKSVEVGQVVQPGQPLLALVDLEDVWVVANFKESQLAAIRSGQPVEIHVDAFDDHLYRGRVDSIAAATGARFSLLPPENATGNYVKVVQRVPVKIVLEPGQDPEHRLRPGMSVVPTVFTE